MFAQSPGAGTQLSNGQTVVSRCRAVSVAVPDVTSLPVQQAQTKVDERRAQGRGQGRRIVEAEGHVIAQSPAAGVTAETGTTVTLTASSGAKPVVVPKVVGQTQGRP